MEIQSEDPGRGRPALKGRSVERVDETHVSWLFFTPDRVFKLKKPVDLGFLDFRRAETRRDACHAEVRLNRRLAGEVYRGVLDVTARDDGSVQVEGPCPGPTCARVGPGEDHLVEMLRLPAERALSERLRAGAAGRSVVQALARRIHRFHAEAETSDAIAAAGSPEAVGRLVVENIEQLAPFASGPIPATLYRRAAEAQIGFLREHAGRLIDRMAAGRVRDGHGDLHLEHVFDLGDENTPRFVVIDCVEFSDRYRHGDVANDVAFLAMSFALLGRDDLGDVFLEAYAGESGDHDLFRVIDFYVLYRALVRLKVACFAAGGDEAKRATVATHVALVRRLLDRTRSPCLVAVGGPVGSGKSTLAREIALRTHAVLIGSDATRKRLLGLAPTDSARADVDRGAYDPALTDRVYTALLDGARAVLSSGRPVVLDATWPTAKRRADLRALASATSMPFRFLNLSCRRDTARARLEAREGRDDVESDARAGDLDVLWPRYEAPDEIPLSERIDLDTGALGVETAVETAICALPVDPTAV
jgi:uncharacterized protein